MMIKSHATEELLISNIVQTAMTGIKTEWWRAGMEKKWTSTLNKQT